MAELRQDPIVGRWVIVNIEDSQSPDTFEKEDHKYKQEATCQFCPGREYQTPPEIEAIRPHHHMPNSQGWSVRVIPNKFPALRIEGDLNRRGIGIYDLSNGVGAHEVLVETPIHRKDLADFTSEEIMEVVRRYKSRSLELAKDKRFKYILIFRNRGDSAGASIEHSHSQIIALPMVPKYVLEETVGAKNYYNANNRCIYCDIIKQEFQDQERIVAENKDFIAFSPYFPRYAYECWIAPKNHEAQFAFIKDDQMYQFSRILKETLFRLKISLSDPSYNYFLHTAPVDYDHMQSYHWHVEVLPKLSRVAGFEWGTGFYICPIDPAKAAKHLRDVNFNFTI